MLPSFYPDPAFGWIFYAVLVGFLAVAAYLDLGWLKIPKKVTLPMLGAGLVVSVVRGAWMGSVLSGSDDQVVFAFANSPVLGALDRLLCSVAGFAVGFGVFSLLWILGKGGGGDVKLMAALGAWVGPKWMLYLIFGSMLVFVVLAVVRLFQKLLRRGVQKTVFSVKEGAARDNAKKTPVGARRRSDVIGYSLPAAVATALLLPCFFWSDLGLPKPVKVTPAVQASTQP